MSGYLNVGIQGSYSALGFILYSSAKAQNKADMVNYPTIIWLNGGPGSTSQVKRYKIVADKKSSETSSSWAPYGWVQARLKLTWDSSKTTIPGSWTTTWFSWISLSALVWATPTTATTSRLTRTWLDSSSKTRSCRLYTSPSSCFGELDFSKTPLFVFRRILRRKIR